MHEQYCLHSLPLTLSPTPTYPLSCTRSPPLPLTLLHTVSSYSHSPSLSLSPPLPLTLPLAHCLHSHSPSLLHTVSSYSLPLIPTYPPSRTRSPPLPLTLPLLHTVSYSHLPSLSHTVSYSHSPPSCTRSPTHTHTPSRIRSLPLSLTLPLPYCTHTRAEPIVPKNLPIVLFQISTLFSLLFQRISPIMLSFFLLSKQ